MRRSPGAWACNGCARSSRTTPFAGSTRKAYAAVVDRLKMLRDRNQGLIEEIENALRKKLEEAKVPAIVAGREKKPYAIWSKMERKQISLEQLSDIYAFRIVVDEVRTATARSPWCTPPGTPCPAASRTTSRARSRTTISRSTPRSSARVTSAPSCRSAPSACIRSPNTAWRRTRSTRTTPTARSAARACCRARRRNAYRWLRHLVDMLLEGDNPEEFLEHTKLELFQDQVFCFTPEGAADRAAARRQPHRLRLCGAHRHRQHLRRLQDQRPPDAARHRAQERRRGRDHHLRGAGAAVGLAEPRRHRQGALGHPARDARRGARPIRQARPRDPRTRLSAAGARPSARKPSLRRSGACRRRPRKTSSPPSAAASLPPPTWSAVWPEDTPSETPKRRRKVKRAEEGWFGLGKVMGLKFRWPGSSSSAAQREPPAGRTASRSGACAAICR